jgi:hypothetical protein
MQLHLRSERTSKRIFEKIFGLETAKGIAGSTFGLLKIRD